MWRLANLYYIVSKGDDEDADGLVVLFKPNRVQRRILAKMWHRNLILKARQLGCTTLIAILWLDTALFSKQPLRCGIIAHEREAAEDIFRSKVLFAYEHLPDMLRQDFPVEKKTATEIQFAHNGSSVRVSTSMRSGTTHRLHVSELGKIAAKYPAKAKEVVAGSIPSVPKSGIVVIESTAEGEDGRFYDMSQASMATAQAGKRLTVRDYRFHFFPWWDEPGYTIDPEGVFLTEAELDYFMRLEARIGHTITPGQRAWYVTTLRIDFSGEAPLMWQEYPSYPEEAFAVSTEGCYYSSQLAKARLDGRIAPMLPIDPMVPVHTFWDLGRSDLTGIWLMQKVGAQYRFIGYYEERGEEYIHFVQYLQNTGFVFARHWLPHDAGHKRQGATPDTNRSPKEMLEDLWPGQRFEIVPRVTQIMTGIQATRSAMASAWIDETRCAQGVKRLANYRKTWDTTRGRWVDDHPVHDDNSNGADAFRQWGQTVDSGETFRSAAPAAAATGTGVATRWKRPKARGRGVSAMSR